MLKVVTKIGDYLEIDFITTYSENDYKTQLNICPVGVSCRTMLAAYKSDNGLIKISLENDITPFMKMNSKLVLFKNTFEIKRIELRVPFVNIFNLGGRLDGFTYDKKG